MRHGRNHILTKAAIALTSLVLLVGLPKAAAEIDGRKLDQEEIVELLSGATLYGVYLDGRPDWAEQSTVTGELYDAADKWREVGRWGTSGDVACYTYWAAMRQYCFDVYEQDGQFYFYVPGTDTLVAYTYRIDRDEMM